MKKLLAALAIIASMGASCFQSIGPPPWGEAYGHFCPPDRSCGGFPAMEHGSDRSSSGGSE